MWGEVVPQDVDWDLLLRRDLDLPGACPESFEEVPGGEIEEAMRVEAAANMKAILNGLGVRGGHHHYSCGAFCRIPPWSRQGLV